MVHLLRNIKPLTISRTFPDGHRYISLAKDNNSYTVFTSEGFVMYAITKEINVEILDEPKGNPENLLHCIYSTQEYEKFKQDALNWLFTVDTNKIIGIEKRTIIIDIINKLKESKI